MNLLTIHGLLAVAQAGTTGWVAGLIVAGVLLLREVFIRVFSNTGRR